ncbi:hypothetical protein VI08_04540 [Luteibacter yeojuensis]|uniref:Uncharacterized protein n=2 Tax=Luteibacter yeojuensis TaxID=345309 RepID=A0A0F3KZ07_9GAMM|nr:hypothetical protein VI08_04540 [Luteibacter yeojuensis]
MVRPDDRAEPPVSTTFCAVQADPAAFAHRRVFFRAEVMSDGIHRTIITDPACSGGMGIDDNSAEKAMDALNDAVLSGIPGTIDKTLQARLTATIERPRGRTTLVVEAVDDIVVTPKDVR